MVEIYTKNKILILNPTVIPQPNITIAIYEWTINNSVIIENLSSTTINTNDLSLGDNTISLRVLNSCGTWSEYITKTINVISDIVTVIYTKNKILTLKVININTGSPDTTIIAYEWKINNIIQSNNTDTLEINTNSLLVGTNIASITIQNSCGSWSNTVSKPIEVYPPVYKTFNISIDNLIVNKSIII